MARPRKFNVDEALDAAMNAFWERGYEATSLADLMQAMGLQKGSIYKAFGDKHSLFMNAMERYLNAAYEFHRTVIEGEASPKEGLKAWIEKLTEFSTSKQGICRGCLMINTTIELGPHDAEMETPLKIHFSRLEKLLAKTVARGQKLSEFRQDMNSTQLGELLLSVMTGLFVGLKGPMTEDKSRRIWGMALQVLE
ncbi:MAG: TetR/AcrR family transcriptional regulator [Pseudanabaenales cyanobacterium]|nr:TetR/AcrR family transcriptional regulator [Pseudanabaenales cyanobacterium]